MKKLPQIKRVPKIICIISAIISAFVVLLFIGDSYFKSDYENPLRVAEAFARSLMFKDTENMKSWSFEEIHSKINTIESSPHELGSLELREYLRRSTVDLVCFRRLRDNIVCTYVLSDISFFDSIPTPLFYSVALKPVGPLSLWERVKVLVCFKVPFAETIIGFPHIKQRWLVVDFYTEDDSEKLISQKIQTFEKFKNISKGTKREFAADKIFEQLKTDALWKLGYENKWCEQETIEQNLEMRKLYKNYLIGPDNKVKEN